MLRNITITLPEEVARWARLQAAEENTSVARLLGRILEERMRASDAYKRAYRRWRQVEKVEGVDAAGRLSREAAHERR